jgi:multidrug efflux system outer membrane protein
MAEIKRQLLIVVLISLAAGCTLGPDYDRPEIEEPVAYRDVIDEGPSIANVEWWTVFNDEQMVKLVEIALEENKNLAIAVARIEEARAALGFVRADQFPRIDGRAGASRGDRGDAIFPGAGINETYILAADLSFEIDIWGKLRRSTEAARAELFATEEVRRVVIITLISDVSSTYLLLRDLDNRLDISQRTLASRTASLAIIQARYDHGTVPLIDVNQAEVELATAAAELAATERETAQTENLLSILLGRNPGPIVRGDSLADQLPLPVVPAGLPSELLERRPDVRAAEQRLHAQTARIGIAEAERLPSLSLTGTLGLISDDLSDLIDSDAKLWDIGGNLNGPIWDTFKSKRRAEVERARTEQLLQEYEQSILQAFREVEDALIAIRTYSDESAARHRQATAARSAATLSWARYDGGVTSYLEVLDSERSYFRAELLDSQTRRAQLVSVVQLYKALGGGWHSEEQRQAELAAQAAAEAEAAAAAEEAATK